MEESAKTSYVLLEELERNLFTVAVFLDGVRYEPMDDSNTFETRDDADALAEKLAWLCRVGKREQKAEEEQ